jgi:hypothetical protein
MYAIHTTPGFIIDSRPRGEASKLLYIFTRDLGLVMATAEGIRLEKSKLRYHTREYTFGTFSFVRGKEFWKLTSAGGLGDDRGREAEVRQGGTSSSDSYIIYDIRRGKGEAFFVQIALLLRRLLHGEEPHPELFKTLDTCREFFEHHLLNEEHLKALESVTVLRILHSLGYVGNSADIHPYVASTEINLDQLQAGVAVRQVINQHINRALKESQL